MITLLKSYIANPVDNNTIKSRAVMKLTGLSTDEKPLIDFKDVEIENGSSFIQIDTSKIYKYDEENNEWIQQIIESGSGSDGVSDVQVNGTSIVENGVANIPVADENIFGVVQIHPYYGIGFVSGQNKRLRVLDASSNHIKLGQESYRLLTPQRQHESTFYGLAKAAGYDEKNSILPVGQYTEEAKTAIRTMLGLEDVYEDYSSALVALGVNEP